MRSFVKPKDFAFALKTFGFKYYFSCLDLLERIRVINDPYTQLAFLIMRADAAWYTAKVTKDATDRRRQYSLAKKRYSELLEKGTIALTSNDRSLLKILEKLSTILAEYPDQQDSQLKNLCWQALRNAEAAIRFTTIDDDSISMINNIKELLECCDFFY
uniref:DUF4294 domain-containing protein n=1 Tax=Ascaris lumbricoides TaxID=6252 RepID=A0A0M3HZN8_ASCLU